MSKGTTYKIKFVHLSDEMLNEYEINKTYTFTKDELFDVLMKINENEIKIV